MAPATCDTSLDVLDHRAQQSQTPDIYSDDVSLAMALRASIDMRTDEVRQGLGLRTGRRATSSPDAAELDVGPAARCARQPVGVLARRSMHARSPRCTTRLTATLDRDLVAGSGAGDAIESLRATLDRCAGRPRCSAAARTMSPRSRRASSRSCRAHDPKAIAPAVAAIDADATASKRELVKEIGLRASVTHDTVGGGRDPFARPPRRRAERCASWYRSSRTRSRTRPGSRFPTSASPVTRPRVPTGDIDAEPGTWTSARRVLDAYLLRLTSDRCGPRRGPPPLRSADEPSR